MRKFYVLVAFSLLVGHVCAEDNFPVYCLENNIIHSYLNDFSYDTVALDTSFVMDYFNRGKEEGYRMDAPKPVSLSWTLDPSTQAQRIEVSESSSYSDLLVYSVAPDKDSYDLYNLIPGKTYYYRVVSVDAASNETIVASGQFETTGLLRMILGEGTWNVRDMGGWISELTGKPIAYGKIYRGAQLKAASKDSIILSAQGIEAMRQVGIRAELDLRSSSQVPSSVSALAKKDADGNYDVDFVVIPEAVNARMLNFDNNDANIRELQWIINRLKQNKPVYFHCQNGADRTGTLGFLIGALLGMNESDLAKDYELTTFCEPYAAAYDPTEVGFARLRDYTGKKGSPLGSGDNGDEYMFAKLVEKMATVAPAKGTYQQKIYNFFRTGVGGTSISPADLSWFILEMTGYPILGGYTIDVDTLKLEMGNSQKINVNVFPAGATYTSMYFKSTSPAIATVSDDGVVTAVGGGKAYILVDVDGIEKYIPVDVPITAESINDYSLYNPIIAQYMNESAYNDDYTVSYIDKYMDMSLGYNRRDWPQSFTLQWVAGEGVKEQHLYVCDTTDFKKCAIDVVLPADESSYVVESLDPGRVYYYKITSKLSSGKYMTLCSSAFILSSTVSILKYEDLYNVRDLGGWTGLKGKKVKYGCLYRGSRVRLNLSESSNGQVLTDAARKLVNLGIKAEIDFRGDDESKSSTSAISRSTKFKRIANAKDCLGANILNGDAFISGLDQIITWLKDKKLKVYIGASLGAERTGAMAFLINGLLGVDEDGLSRDYELSSFTEDELAAGKVWKRSDANYRDMVAAIKSLDEDATLQENIYKYFNEGVNGKSISKTNLDWFIDFMLEDVKLPFTDVEPITVDGPGYVKGIGKTYNMFGFEADITGPGLYIIDGKTVYVTE